MFSITDKKTLRFNFHLVFITDQKIEVLVVFDVILTPDRKEHLSFVLHHRCTLKLCERVSVICAQKAFGGVTKVFKYL